MKWSANADASIYTQLLFDASVNQNTQTFQDASGTIALLSDIPTVPSFANPTGSIGLSAVNGSATTMTRSDATHALDQGIVPTWTGAHIWSANGTFNAELIANGQLVTPSNPQTISAATDTIDPTVSPYTYLTNTTGNITLTSTPTIADGVDGQILVVMNSTGSTGRVILQRKATLPGSNLSLGAATRVLFPGGSITLIFSSTSGLWMELAFTTSTS